MLAPNSKHSQTDSLFYYHDNTWHFRYGLKKERWKLFLMLKFFSFLSPILFIDTFRYNNFTFLSEFHCHFFYIRYRIKWMQLQLIFLSPVFLQRKCFFMATLFNKKWSLQHKDVLQNLLIFCNFWIYYLYFRLSSLLNLGVPPLALCRVFLPSFY